MMIFPEFLSPPLPDVKVERLIFNAALNPSHGFLHIFSYVVQHNDTDLWQAVRVELWDSTPLKRKIIKRGRWVKGGHTAIANAKKFEGMD